MNALADAWSKRNYAFALVYVMEAHAVDEWPVAMCEKDFEQHRTFADRASAAETLLKDFTVSRNLPVFVDGIANGFNAAYASWPFRWWVLTPNQEEEAAQGGAPRRPCPRRAATVAQKPMPRNAQYDLDELEGWLEEDSRRTPRRT